MIQPVKYKSREPLNSLTGIKSSLGNLRKVVALTYLLYLASNKNDMVVYSIGNDNGGIDLKDEYKRYILAYLNNLIQDSDLQSNPLLNSQIESLYVGITLMFGLGKISFENSSLSMTKERTGGKRYAKQIQFASNIITLDLILQSIEENSRKQFLCAWIKDEHLHNDIELRVATFLNICIENNLFKLRKSNDDILFQTEGIYLGLNKDSEVSLESDEKVGPARIFNSMLNEGLVPWLTVNHSTVSYDKNCSFNGSVYSKIISTSLDIRDIKVEHNNDVSATHFDSHDITLQDITLEKLNIINALRTKPFLLLAGISGTGKSRIVKELAFDSCPNDTKLREDETRPGNYCLIEVKPNWHDSTELLGYQSAIAKTYVLTPFVKFLAKAMLYPDVPFFVCLDEMNLAPVEQYFAEFLSVLESRKKLESGEIVSEPLIKADVFKANDLRKALFSREEEKKAAYDSSITDDPQSEYSNADEQAIYEILKRDGLRIPQNVIVIGTVNMDETTHQFSRKVIDRAMTIEMNLPEDKPFMKFFAEFREIGYREIVQPKELYLASEVSADKVVATLREADEDRTNNWLLPEVAQTLTALNEALEGTPFKVAYRVQNEMMLYFGELWKENKEAEWSEILATTVDQILMMKVLPRVEGDEDLLEKPLERLATFCANYPHAAKKVAEMKERLSRSHFASYWP
jgi:hypothetical protein